VSALPHQREIFHLATPRLHHRCHLGLRHHQDPRQKRSPHAAPAQRCSSRVVSGKAPVVNLSSSSGEEDFIPDVSRDFEFAQWLFGDLNCDVLGPPGDDKTTILNDSDEEKEEAHEEKPTGAEDVTASAAVNPTSTAFAGAVNTPSGAKSDNSDDQGPDQKAGSDHDSGDDVGEP
jgi:hypothetical protein